MAVSILRKRPNGSATLAMSLWKLLRYAVSLLVLMPFTISCLNIPAQSKGTEVYTTDVQFQPLQPPKAVTLGQAVDIALRNYPALTQKQFKLRAAKANVTLAKTQYLPNLNLDLQESGVTANRIASVVMNNVSGFDTVPVDSGPPATSSSLKPGANNLQGANLNWLLVDFGLRRANDNLAYAEARIARADLNLTKLDVAFATASAFLRAVASKEEIFAAKAALAHMQSANVTAKTLVAQGLKPGVEAADWEYEVSKAKIILIKAERNARLALVDLAESMGTATTNLDVISEPLIHHPVTIKEMGPFDLRAHPLALFKLAEISRWKAKEIVLDRAYRPHLWLNSSLWGRGSNASVNPIKPVAGGTLPQVFNYMFGVSFSFPLMEYFPLKAQKEIAKGNELAAQADLNLALQILEKKDAQARIWLNQSLKVAGETPTLVESANVREIKVLQRYRLGLTNMVSLAQAEKALAEAQVENAIAQIDVWRSVLSLAYIQGDLTPFLQLVDIAQGNIGGR